MSLKSFHGRKVPEIVKEYTEIIMSNSAILNLVGPPGSAKSAIIRDIAEDFLGYQFIDRRLAQISEAGEILGMPRLVEVEPEVWVMKYALPEWAWMANKRPTIICFDEANRAEVQIINAALQILNERMIGSFKFNDDVRFVLAGNLGEDDGTDVNYFDTAMNGRLCHVNHTLSFDQWVEMYVEYKGIKINHYILTFLKHYAQDLFHKLPDEASGDPAYPSARTWTNFSKYLEFKFNLFQPCTWFNKENPPLEIVLDKVRKYGKSFVGVDAARRFERYLEGLMKVSYDDVINNFETVEDLFKTDSIDLSMMTEILSEIKAKDFSNDFTIAQVKNICKFLSYINQDIRVGFLQYATTKWYAMVLPGEKKRDNLKVLLNHFRSEGEQMIDSNDNLGKKRKEA